MMSFPHVLSSWFLTTTLTVSPSFLLLKQKNFCLYTFLQPLLVSKILALIDTVLYVCRILLVKPKWTCMIFQLVLFIRHSYAHWCSAPPCNACLAGAFFIQILVCLETNYCFKMWYILYSELLCRFCIQFLSGS
jgi:hypothetical protein